jgi:hypothetical protein
MHRLRICLFVAFGLSAGACLAAPAHDRGDGSAAVEAAMSAAESSTECKNIAPFYWEIGDGAGPLASGSVGGVYTAATELPIASASKLLWGAYVVERFKTDVAAIDLARMTMMSGYTNMKPGRGQCTLSPSVGACLNEGNNGQHNNADDGYFQYNSGHFQDYAVELGLGSKTRQGLAAEYSSKLGTDLGIKFASPLIAGGVVMTAGGYARFLRKIIDGSLALNLVLGQNAVCTLKSACPKAHFSPVPEAWHYSYGHWVEDDPATGDGSFSSPGLFGFYPWISATKKIYGIVARADIRGLKAGSPADTAYWKSVLCGREIRRAFFTAR